MQNICMFLINPFQLSKAKAFHKKIKTSREYLNETIGWQFNQNIGIPKKH